MTCKFTTARERIKNSHFLYSQPILPSVRKKTYFAATITKFKIAHKKTNNSPSPNLIYNYNKEIFCKTYRNKCRKYEKGELLVSVCVVAYFLTAVVNLYMFVGYQCIFSHKF